MPAEALKGVRARVEAGQFAVPPDMQRAILARVDDLITALTAADRALSKLPESAVSEAAAKMAYLFYISGHGWRRYVSETKESAAAGSAVSDAVLAGVTMIVSDLSRAIDARAATNVVRHTDLQFALTCAACGGDAVTFVRSRVSPSAPEQVVVSSMSPVTVFRPIAGPRIQDLVQLLEAADAAGVVDYLRVTQPGGCDAYCTQCSRVFCKEHYAIEAQWSGSWHEATYATCPVGHEREID